MRRLAIIADVGCPIAKAITEYFQNKNVELELLTSVGSSVVKQFSATSDPLNRGSRVAALSNTSLKRLALVPYSEPFSDNNYDLVACVHKRTDLPNAINIHASLLPSFDTENPVLDAFMYGAKVTGVTIQRGDGKIIIQYPVLIGNLTHFDELQEKITEIEKKIYPKVIEKLLKDEVFDFDDLFGGAHGCGSGCGGCGGCKGCH